MARFALRANSSLILGRRAGRGAGGEGVLTSHFNLSKQDIGSWSKIVADSQVYLGWYSLTTRLFGGRNIHFNDGKMARFAVCANSSLIDCRIDFFFGGGGGG